MTLSDTICIQARLTLRTTAEGGRQTGIKTNYKPNHVFEYKSDGTFVNTYIGEIIFDKDKTILPGETAIVTVCFLKHPDINKFLRVGRQWNIQEGYKLLGHAEILKL